MSDMLPELECDFETMTSEFQSHLWPATAVYSVLIIRPWPIHQSGLAPAEQSIIPPWEKRETHAQISYRDIFGTMTIWVSIEFWFM